MLHGPYDQIGGLQFTNTGDYYFGSLHKFVLGVLVPRPRNFYSRLFLPSSRILRRASLRRLPTKAPTTGSLPTRSRVSWYASTAHCGVLSFGQLTCAVSVEVPKFGTGCTHIKTTVAPHEATRIARYTEAEEGHGAQRPHC